MELSDFIFGCQAFFFEEMDASVRAEKYEKDLEFDLEYEKLQKVYDYFLKTNSHFRDYCTAQNKVTKILYTFIQKMSYVFRL